MRENDMEGVSAKIMTNVPKTDTLLRNHYYN